MPINSTHEPTLTSWVDSANVAQTDFPIQNLPHGVFRRSGSNEAFRGGVAIGDQILDMAAASALGIFSPGEGEKGCLMEITSAGRQPVTLPNGETRAMLEDGDTVVLRAWAEKPGAVRIGLGECRGTVLPARPG